MATLVTRDGKQREFAEVWVTEGGLHLCFADGYREEGVDADLVVPSTTVNRVEPDQGVETETFALECEVGRGRSFGANRSVVRSRSDFATRVFEETRIR